MSGFYIDSHSPSPSSRSLASSDSESDDNLDTLPFAVPLPRSAFLSPTFTPSTYLSTLHNRHQTLEDLRSELRSRSQLLSRELLDLVNSNYQDFLGLGRSLKGGDEKVEEVRVGLLGLRKEVEASKNLVTAREAEVRGLVEEKVEVRRRIMVGRRLVEYDARLKALEELLVIETTGKDALANGQNADVDNSDSEEESGEDDDDDDDDDEDDGTMGVSISKLKRHVLQYQLVQELEKGLEEHPFIVTQAPRIMKVRNTMLLDLSTALQQAKSVGKYGQDKVVKIIKIYADMEESSEAVKVLKTLKR